MIIKYFPGEKRPSVACCTRFEHVTLHPGDNEVSFDDWVLIKKHPHYKNDRNLGVIVEVRDKPPAKKKTAKSTRKQERIEARQEARKEEKAARKEEKAARKEKQSEEVTENADL